jgi:hypothetical protein
MKFYHFIPTDGAHLSEVPDPILSKDAVPEWYRKSEITYTDDAGNPVNGLKTCVPFLDGLLSGYMLVTWTDIHVKKLPNGEIDIDWGTDVTSPQIGERKGKSGIHIPRPAGHLPHHLVWTPKWGVKSPRGWSTLFTHPLNRFDLPFTTMSAIIDSDKYYGSGNVPFFLKEGFEGVIPKGTPFAQLIPIKRADWTAAVYDPSFIAPLQELGTAARSVNRGWYRDNSWVKKIYNITKLGKK